MSLRTFLLCAACLAASYTTASAAEISPLLRASVDFGGDELATVIFTDGEQETTRAGDGLHFAAGVGLKHSPSWYSQASIGYKMGGTVSQNGELTLTSIPLELMSFHQTPRWRAGFGVSYVSHLEMDSSGVLEGLNVSFENATGFIAEWQWLFSPNDRYYLGIRANVIEHKIDHSDATINGNNLGIAFGINL